MEKLSAEWRARIEPIWKARHEEVRKIRDELGPEESVATAEDAWKWATAMIDLEDDRAAMPWVERVLGMEPGHVGARFVKGRHLLSNGDEQGVAMLEEVMHEDRGLGMEVLGLLHGHYARRGEVAKLDEITRRADNLDEFYELADRERQGVTKADTLIPHALPEETLDACRKVFAAESVIEAVHAARKEVRHMPKVPMHVFSLDLDIPAFKLRTAQADQELVHRVLEALPVEGTTVVVINHKDQKWLGRRVAGQAGALVYRREG